MLMYVNVYGGVYADVCERGLLYVKLFMFSNVACHFLSNEAIILIRKRELYAQKSKQVRCQIKCLYPYTRKMRMLV